MHRNDFDAARRLIAEAGGLLSETRSIRADNPEIYHAGFLADARKEYAEANIALAIIAGEDIPDAGALDIDPPAYLNGMAEVIGELRRYILDALRRDEAARGEELMAVMDEIYGILVTVDFPEPVTGGPAPQRRRNARRPGTHPRRPHHIPPAASPGAQAGGNGRVASRPAAAEPGGAAPGGN